MSSLGTSASNRPIVQAQGDYVDGEIGGMIMSQCRFVHHKPHKLCPDANPGRRGRLPATNRLSYRQYYDG
jgi:hypothetical protein